MIHSLMRKRNALLTTAVLCAFTLPAYAADADADPLQVKTDPIVVTASRTEQAAERVTCLCGGHYT